METSVERNVTVLEEVLAILNSAELAADITGVERLAEVEAKWNGALAELRSQDDVDDGDDAFNVACLAARELKRAAAAPNQTAFLRRAAESARGRFAQVVDLLPTAEPAQALRIRLLKSLLSWKLASAPDVPSVVAPATAALAQLNTDVQGRLREVNVAIDSLEQLMTDGLATACDKNADEMTEDAFLCVAAVSDRRWAQMGDFKEAVRPRITKLLAMTQRQSESADLSSNICKAQLLLRRKLQGLLDAPPTAAGERSTLDAAKHGTESTDVM